MKKSEFWKIHKKLWAILAKIGKILVKNSKKMNKINGIHSMFSKV